MEGKYINLVSVYLNSRIEESFCLLFCSLLFVSSLTIFGDLNNIGIVKSFLVICMEYSETCQEIRGEKMERINNY